MEHRGKCILASCFFLVLFFETPCNWGEELEGQLSSLSWEKQLFELDSNSKRFQIELPKNELRSQFKTIPIIEQLNWAPACFELSFSEELIKLLKSGDFEPALRLRGEFPKSWDGLQGTWKAWARVDNPGRFQFRTCSIQKHFNWKHFRTSWFQF